MGALAVARRTCQSTLPLLTGLLGLCAGAMAQEGAQPLKAPASSMLCVTCHGPLGKSLTPDAPHIAGQPLIYLVEQLKAFRSGQRRHAVMNVIARPLSDAEIAELGQWYSAIAFEVRAP